MITRNFTWADLPALTEFISLVRRAEGDERTVSTSSLREYLARPGLAPEENCSFFVSDEAELRAFFILHPELRIGRTVLELGIHPSYTETGIARQVIRSALDRAKRLGARVLHICLSPSEFWRVLLEEEGFSRVRVYWAMQWHEAATPRVALPQGFAIESFRPGDEERLTQVQNASFGGSWGFCPNTVEEVRYGASMSICPPEGILFLTDRTANGDVTAGYCWTCVLPGAGTRSLAPSPDSGESSIGVIGMIGITPPYRGRGLSAPILLAGMEYLHSRGVKYIRLDVDGGNTPAIKLYTSVGFKNAQDLHWFEARL